MTGLQNIGFVLVPQFSMFGFSNALEPLRQANRQAGRDCYAWRTYSPDGEPIAASNGITLLPDGAPDNSSWPDLVLVCGGINIQDHADPAVQRWLRTIARKGVALGGISTGSYVLARAGLLNGYRCTIHWENLFGFGEQFPQVQATENLFEIDRDRYTCSGGTGSLDMMLHIIAQAHGQQLAAAVSGVFMHDRMRTESDQQLMIDRIRLLRKSAKLANAIRLMTAHLEQPLPTAEVARRSGVSMRHLERLFKKHERCTPQRYYLRLRLQRARSLLAQTGLSIMNVALATGFPSQSHFTKCYREHFDITPQRERRTM